MRVNNLKYKPNELSSTALAASRQVWLAGLGAAVISRDWIQAEAGSTFRSLVKEGTVVESRAIRFVGGQLESGVLRANALWRTTRSRVQSTVRQAADSAVLFVKDTLPRSLPKLELATGRTPARKTVRRATKAKPVTVHARGGKAKTAKKASKR